MMTIVKNNWKLLIGIVLVILLVSTYLFSNKTPQGTAVISSLLEEENKALLARNVALDHKIQSIKQRAERLQETIDQKDQQIYHLKITLDEKMDRINHFSILELEQFFTSFRTDSIPH